MGLSASSYTYICSNETVSGNEICKLPTGLSSPLVADASSHFLSRPMDASACGLIYAGAQKNIGLAGVIDARMPPRTATMREFEPI